MAGTYSTQIFNKNGGRTRAGFVSLRTRTSVGLLSNR